MTANRPALAPARLLLALAGLSLAPALTPGEKAPGPQVIRFGKGAWDPAGWKPVRLANQKEPVSFARQEGALATTLATFTAADYGREADNAILIHDLGTAEAEVEVDFSL